MDIKIVGNDIELGGEKVARIFDIRASLRGELQDAIDNAERYDRAIEDGNDKAEDAFSKGYDQGWEVGNEEGMEAGFEKGKKAALEVMKKFWEKNSEDLKK
jgi:flagellar biosynthesis/type III secretory pathway protein FliH